ncbi:MAG TPA: endonuclease/exonuclease/phosphatase family protein [Planctomycetota bacterium]|nr:endonuclease/exonuclease/phosphatase family protein [Planctomycetota bacterium]
MADSRTQSLRIAWWNSRLAPKGKASSDSTIWKRASAVIAALIKRYRIDLLAIGEVAEGQLQRIVTESCLEGFRVHESTGRDGRLQFETGLLYRSALFRIIKHKPILSFHGSKRNIVGNRIDLQISRSGELFYLFVSHWSMRRTIPKNDPRRLKLGDFLRSDVNELLSDRRSPPNIILLGDYNDEPFDTSISECLFATRDRRLAQKNGRLLYNPFWRHLGEPEPHGGATAPAGYPGTAYHRSGDETCWRTVDQIIFSSAFVEGGNWQLNEALTSILQLEGHFDDITHSKAVFDHFPVIATVERKEQRDGELQQRI